MAQTMRNKRLYDRAIANAKRWYEDPESKTMSMVKWAEKNRINSRTLERHVGIARQDGHIPPGPGRPGDPGAARDVIERWLAIPNHDQIRHREAAEILGVEVATLTSYLSRARRRGWIPQDTKRQEAWSRGRIIPSGTPRLSDDDKVYLLEEWEHLRQGGISIEEAARRLDTTVHMLNHLQEAS